LSKNHLGDGRQEDEERHDILPVSPPGLANTRITLSPFGLEVVEAGIRQILGLGATDRANPRHDRLAVFQLVKANELRI
jgi:hypothetical protein